MTTTANVEMPRMMDFMDELPRHRTGKLCKRLIRALYWAKTAIKPGVPECG